MANQHVAPSAAQPDVVVLGGGIAGIATALRLLEGGCRVTLVETRRFLGGRVFSFTDSQTGIPVDNGQHVIVGCCHNFIGLLQRLGVWDRWYLQRRLHINVWDRRGRRGRLTTSPLPSPFHLLPSFLTYAHLGMGDKLRIMWALARAKFTNRHRPDLESRSFRQWLVEQGQTQRAMDNFWSLIITPILNDDIQDVSASMGIMVVQEGMLAGYHDADMGYALRGLSDSLGGPARQRLEELGCRVMLGCPVRRLLWDGQQVEGVELASGETITADFYVSALPHYALRSALPREAGRLPFFRQIEGLETSPIVNIHLWYDRPVMEGDFIALVDSPLQWVFNRSEFMVGADQGPGQPPAAAPTQGGIPPGGEGQYICISHSAAWKYIDWAREDLVREFTGEMARVFPRAAEAQVVRALVVKQRDATFRCLPGANGHRPGSVTPLPNLLLAGEWTNTGWPSTMEGAALSGYKAAIAVMEAWETRGKGESAKMRESQVG